MQGFSPPFFDHREKSGSRCRNATDAVIRPRTGGMGPGEAEPATALSGDGGASELQPLRLPG